MAVPLHIQVREWFADASGQQLPHIRPVPRGAKRRRQPVLSWENPMPGYMRAGIAVLSLAAAVSAACLLAVLLFAVYTFFA